VEGRGSRWTESRTRSRWVLRTDARRRRKGWDCSETLV